MHQGKISSQGFAPGRLLVRWVAARDLALQIFPTAQHGSLCLSTDPIGAL